MPRSRNVKPSLFENELLGVCDPMITLTFINLWCLADKQGRLEDRPLRIKAQTFPYRDIPNETFNGYLTVLSRLGFIHRYKVDDLAIIQVVNFGKHQSPHHTEKESVLPAMPIQSVESINHTQITVNAPLSNGTCTVEIPLIPDSCNRIPDSLIPEKIFSPETAPAKVSRKKPRVQLNGYNAVTLWIDALHFHGKCPDANADEIDCKWLAKMGNQYSEIVFKGMLVEYAKERREKGGAWKVYNDFYANRHLWRKRTPVSDKIQGIDPNSEEALNAKFGYNGTVAK